MAVEIVRWQLTVADFARMAEAGIFTEDDRVELIDGEVRVMSPIGPLLASLGKAQWVDQGLAAEDGTERGDLNFGQGYVTLTPDKRQFWSGSLFRSL